MSSNLIILYRAEETIRSKDFLKICILNLLVYLDHFFQLGESGEFFWECSNEGTPENISDVAKASKAPVVIVEYGA